MVENIMIKQIFSVFFDLILFIHAWKKQTILIIRKKKKKKKDCVFFSFWQHVQYLFQWKGENTEKKIIFLWHPNNEIFSCTYALLKMKLNQNKIVNNIEKGNYHHRTPHPLKLQKYPLFWGGTNTPPIIFFCW